MVAGAPGCPGAGRHDGVQTVRALAVLGVLIVGAQVAPLWSLHLTIDHPPAGKPVFGVVRFAAEVLPTVEVREVVFLVDGAVVGSRRQPPFEIEVELGDANQAHVFEVLATDRAGMAFRSTLETPALPIDLAVDVSLQQLYLTVTELGQRVPNLDRGDFRILDNRRPQRIVTFERGDIPFVAVLLLDASRSMKGAKLDAALAGAETFVAAMNPLDQAKLILFNDTINRSTPFTSFPEVLSLGLTDVQAAGGTSLNDNLYFALKLLEQEQGRRLVILLTDGVDLTSVLTMKQVLQTARRSQSLVYWIRLGEPRPNVSHFSAWRDGESHAQELAGLEQLIAVTGGAIHTVARISEVPQAFVSILDEIRNQYVLGYYPSENRDDGRWHRIRVEVDRPGLQVRTREGYLDF